MMKLYFSRVLATVLAAVMILSLAACGAGNTTANPETPAAPTETTPQEPAQAPTEQPTEQPAEQPAESADPLADYIIPWTVDASAQAVENGTIEFYFMSSHGMQVILDDSSDQFKWGDSCLIALPGGETMLIDSGVTGYAQVLLRNLERLGVEKLDYVIISHQHSDHAYGLISDGGILDTMEVGKVYYNALLNEDWSDPYRLTKRLEAAGVEHEAMYMGDSFTVGDVTFQALWPDPAMGGDTLYSTTDLNNHSLLVRLDYGEFSALFPGDLYKAGERDVIEQCGDLLDVDLVKIPHHGHNTSSSAEFGEAVTAEIAVATGFVGIATGNYYSYSKHGARVLFDYQDGYIHITAANDGTLDWETSLERQTDIYDGLDKAAGLS